MNKNTYKTEKLGRGTVASYDFGAVKLHAYQTNDPIDDQVFIFEKAGHAVLLESPCFFDNNRELAAYLSDKGLTVAGMLLAYHMDGGTFLPDVKKYATENADTYGHAGGGAALVQQFTQTFGGDFDGKLHTVTDLLKPGPVEIGGIRFVICQTADAFDVEIPELHVVYTHMLGHDSHSILAGPAHADAILAQLHGYLDKGYTLILSSHSVPEDLKDVETKIAYIEKLQALAQSSANAEAFCAAMRAAYPAYSGDPYLDMTAGFFFGS